MGLEAQFSTGPGSHIERKEAECQLPCLTSLHFTLLMLARGIDCGPHWISLIPGMGWNMSGYWSWFTPYWILLTLGEGRKVDCLLAQLAAICSVSLTTGVGRGD